MDIKICVNKLWSHQAQIMVKSFILTSSNLAPSDKIQNLFGHMTPLSCHCHMTYIAIVVAWIPSDCLEINNSNAHLNQVNYWLKTLCRWQYESRNSSPWRYKFRKSREKNKTHTRSVFGSTRPPPPPPPFPRNHQGSNHSSFGLKVTASWFLRGVLVEQNSLLGGFYYCVMYVTVNSMSELEGLLYLMGLVHL